MEFYFLPFWTSFNKGKLDQVNFFIYTYMSSITSSGTKKDTQSKNRLLSLFVCLFVGLSSADRFPLDVMVRIAVRLLQCHWLSLFYCKEVKFLVFIDWRSFLTFFILLLLYHGCLESLLTLNVTHLSLISSTRVGIFRVRHSSDSRVKTTYWD